MILSDLRCYLKEQRRISLRNLIQHFDIDAEAMRGMLQILVAKKYVQKVATTKACGTSCCECDSTLIEIYEWLDH